MKNLFSRVASFIIAAAVVIGCFSCVVFADSGSLNCSCEYYPTILVPGIFQGDVRIYNEDGTIKLNEDGEDYRRPLFLPSTDTIVKNALKKALIPLLGTLIFQRDINGRCKQALADVIADAFSNNASDASGKTVLNVQPARYTAQRAKIMKELEAQKKAEFGEDYKLSEDDLHGVVFPECRRDVDLDSLEYVSVAECAEYDQKHILETLPIQRFVDTAGADHVYFLSYNSFGNNMEIAKELNNMIKQVIKKTGHDKVNLVSISMGGSITDTLLEVFNNEEYIADNGGDCNLNSLINRIVYIVPALNGSRTISDIFEFGLLDDDDALYDYMFPALVGEEGYTGELINILIRLFPKDVLNGIIDSCVDELINRVLRYSTTIWGLITYEHYEGGDGLVSCADKYLSDPELAELRRQTDIFHTAQGNRFKNIQSAIDSGVDVLNVSDYNYDLYAIVDAYNEVNSDGIIPIDSAALGATSFGNNVQLPEGYQPDPESCHCTNPEHNHIDPYNILDASTGYLPENTWYVYGQDHESTGHCQVVLDLCVDLLLDYDFDTIYDRPEYPQFILYKNTEDQDIRKMIADTAAWDISRVSEDSAAALGASIDELNTIYENNIADKNRYDSAVAQFKNCYDDVRYQLMNDDQKADYDNQKKAEKRDNAIGAVLGKLNDFLNRTLGYKGFSDIFRWW